jgi:hypothetical protein
MPNPTKISTWEGKNKARIRLFKKFDIELLSDTGVVPVCLTFAGATAKLERLVIAHKLVKPSNIVTIQTYEKLSPTHNGKEILEQLLEVRKQHSLRNMYIWPYNFKSFSECYLPTGCKYPSEYNEAEWSKPPLKELMDRLVNIKTKKFNVLDLDFCGIFNENNSESVVNLFKSGVMDIQGTAFITHQKGRDVRGGKLFDILHGYLKNHPYIDFNSIPHINEKNYDTYVARYILIPLFYMLKAYENGYVMSLNRLIEYRDKNENSGLAVNMLQYFFAWAKTSELKDPYGKLKPALTRTMDERYQYFKWID